MFLDDDKAALSAMPQRRVTEDEAVAIMVKASRSEVRGNVTTEQDMRDAYRAILPLINAGTQQQWQSIESAPKDGTRILVYLRPLPQHAEMHVDAQHSWCDKAHWTNYNGGGWVHYQLGIPTHWMPLPTPPESKVEGR